MKLPISNPSIFAVAILDTSISAAGAIDNVDEELTVVDKNLSIYRNCLSGHITVVDRETLDILNSRTVKEALRPVTGLQVSQQGEARGITSVHMLGGESNFVVTMIDGVQVNDPTNSRGGSYDIATRIYDAGEPVNPSLRKDDSEGSESESTCKIGLRYNMVNSRTVLSENWGVSPRVTVNLLIDNIFDSRYGEAIGFSSPGIQPRISISYHRSVRRPSRERKAKHNRQVNRAYS